MPVSCYICGRDFGTRSISIHIPNCIKKWDSEQKKLPKSQRRPPPQAPVDLEKVISGEIKGEELDKFNTEALRDWNDAALMPCKNCSRTFLPSSLKIHQKVCTPEKPMIKQAKDSSYTAKQEAKVKYPKHRHKKKSEEEEGGKEREERKERKREVVAEEVSDERPNEELSKTFSKVLMEEGEDPCKELLADMILNNSVFEDTGNRREFEQIITKFIAGKTKRHH